MGIMVRDYGTDLGVQMGRPNALYKYRQGLWLIKYIQYSKMEAAGYDYIVRVQEYIWLNLLWLEAVLGYLMVELTDMSVWETTGKCSWCS